MSLRHWISLGILAVLSAGCVLDGIFGSRSVEVSRRAVVTNTCGPLDGPAIDIYVSANPVTSLELPVPHVRIYLWSLEDQFSEWSWTLTDAGQGGAVTYASGSEDPERAVRAEVRIDAVASDSTLHGYMDASFRKAGQVRGEFEAVWIRRQYICG